MAVIINDFEIIPEPPPPDPTSQQASITPESIRLSPEDVIAIQKRALVRAARVRAD